jgi:hypothetical protein
VILYRPGAGYPWQGTAFTRVGPWMSGVITVESLQKGEYSLAIWDELYLGKNGNKPVKSSLMKIYPNPAKSAVNIEFDVQQETLLSIYDSLGKQLGKTKFNPGLNHFSYQNPGKVSSVYFFKLTDSNGNLLESRKVVFE